MSDIRTILPEGYGMPLAWLYTPSGDVLRDFDNTPITKYVEDFEYEYAEEDDDTCTIKLKLPNVSSLDLPYFQQDVVLHVQWGFLLNNGKVIKSPIRKVAIRDLDVSYSPSGISLTLECTDLVAYLKGFRTNTLKNGSNAAKISRAVDRSEDYFLKWLSEVAEGNFTTTYTKGNNVTRIDMVGNFQNGVQDNLSGRFKVIPNLEPLEDLPELTDWKVKKGKSKTITQAIEDELKLQSDIALSGKPIMDTTDNNIHIKYRNYDLPIFKTYIWAQGDGELIKFDSNTSTRATKEDSATSTGVNPYNKEIRTTTVETADTSKNDYTSIPKVDLKTLDFSNADNSRTRVGETPYKPTEETIDAWLHHAREVHQYNRDHPTTQKELPDLRYVVQKEYVNDPVMGTRTSPTFVTIPSKQVINSPDFIQLNEKISNEIKAKHRKAANLAGEVTEKIQRKYEGTMEVIGDPSLIKGKVISVTGLGRLDNGKWYITRARHTIRMSQGYMVTLDILKKPKTINISAKSMAINPDYNPESNQLFWPATTEEEVYKMFEEKVVDDQRGIKLDDVEINRQFRTEEDDIRDIEERLEYLNAEEDYVLHKDAAFEPVKKTDNITNTDIN